MYRSLPFIMSRVFGPPLLIAVKGTTFNLDSFLDGLVASMRHRGSLQLPAIEAAFDKDESAPPVDQKPRGYSISKGIATVPVHGVLVRRAGQVDSDSTPLMSYEALDRIIGRTQTDNRVRGTLLDIDSPGGEAGGVFDAAATIRRASRAKPVWSVANDDALSAAYVLASAADRVWATQTASLGSLGVVALHADQSGKDQSEGFKYTYLYRGAHKIDAHPHGPLSSEATLAIQGEVDRLYDKLVTMVGEHREIDPKLIRAQEARVYFGEHAKSEGLVDRIGTLGEAHAALAEFTQQGRARMDDTTTQTQTPPAQPADNVVQIATARSEGEAAARANAREIAELCSLAGLPELAAGFIGESVKLDEVRKKLLEAQATATAKRSIVAMDTSAVTRDADVRSKLSKAAADRYAAMARPHPER